MANRSDMEITISEDGDVQIQVKCVDGTSCVDMTKALEDALGVVRDRQLTSEYYKPAVLETGVNQTKRSS